MPRRGMRARRKPSIGSVTRMTIKRISLRGRGFTQLMITRATISRIQDEILPAAEENLKLSLASPDPDEPVAVSRIEAQRSYAEISQQYLDALVRHRRSMFRLNTVVGCRVFP